MSVSRVRSLNGFKWTPQELRILFFARGAKRSIEKASYKAGNPSEPWLTRTIFQLSAMKMWFHV
jgi:hypothetical protein